MTTRKAVLDGIEAFLKGALDSYITQQVAEQSQKVRLLQSVDGEAVRQANQHILALRQAHQAVRIRLAQTFLDMRQEIQD